LQKYLIRKHSKRINFNITMNILIITPWFPTEDSPAAGAFVLEQAKALKKKHNVFVLTPQLCAKGKKPEIESGEVDGVEYLMPEYKTLPKLGIPFYVFAVIRSYLKIRKKFKPDIIHPHVIFLSGFAGLILGKLTGKPVVITEHYSYIDKLCENRIPRAVYKISLKNAKMVIAVSNVLERTLKKYCEKSNIRVIPNIVDLSLFEFKGNKKRHNKAVFIGLLDTERKNLDHLLKAFKKVVVVLDYDFYIDILGTGKLKHRYEALAEELEIGKYCRFLGTRKTLAEVAEVIDNSDFLVLPSSYENFGVVLIEAMALGKPVIATKCGGPEEIVKDFNGILVDIGDIEGLSAAIMTIIKNLDTYEKEKIVGYVRDNYSAEGVADQLTEIYNNFISSKN